MMMQMENSHGTHPFFQSRSIPHRAINLPEISDNIGTLPQPAESNHVNSRKRKARPLDERASNTRLSQSTQSYSSIDSNSVVASVVESNMDKAPTKKVLRLNSNGTLLSSPPVVPVDVTTVKETVTTSHKAVTRRTEDQSAKSRSSSLLAKISYGREDLDQRLRLGTTIGEVLGSTKEMHLSKGSARAKKEKTPKKSTHPFFSGKLKPTNEDDCHKGQSSETEASTSPAKSVSKTNSPQTKPAWKDITFSSRQNLKQHNEASTTPWPAKDMQRVDDLPHKDCLHCLVPSSHFPIYKSKDRASTQFPGEGDILQQAAFGHYDSQGGSNHFTARHPARKVLSGDEMSSRLEDKLLVGSIHLATQRIKSILTTTLTAYDQGRSDHSSWTAKSSPSRAVEVLQPGPEAVLLRDWVENLTITSVEGAQSVEAIKVSKPRKRKRRQPKRSDDDIDFIVSSEDEADELREIDQSTRENSPFIDDVKRSVLRAGAINSLQDVGQRKNAILISGPTGCGKTASVYAVAGELGFEVFEIHPGTRRGAKEMLEKVGDMTQNHLVQHQTGDDSVEKAQATPIDEGVVQDEIASGKQRTMNGFFRTQSKTASKVGRKRKAVQQDDQEGESTIKKPRKAQKQSLILLEEVDILFEDDKSFWVGVMSLINQSKRPIILTCNDETALPLDELPLHGILRYSPPPEELATDYLLTLAASEGHELEREAVSYLYRSQKHDLRATITELDFWCQMGIGSRKGGLDWMLNRRNRSATTAIDKARPRVFSTNTYLLGMGLTQQQSELDPEQLVFDAYQQLGIPIDTWCAEADRTIADSSQIRDASISADLYSDLDLCQQIPFDTDPSDLQLHIGVSLTVRLSPKPPTSADIINAHIKQPQSPKLTRSTFTRIFEPLTNEKPIFPPAQGRLAPSLDLPISTISTDIAPYIRSIIAFEQKWGASLPLPRRNTRATARPEGHFPRKINAEHVLMTGGDGWQDLWVKPVDRGHVDEDAGNGSRLTSCVQ